MRIVEFAVKVIKSLTCPRICRYLANNALTEIPASVYECQNLSLL